MNETYKYAEDEQRQLKIFLWVTFGLTILMGLLMGVSFNKGDNVTTFSAAQMLYPAMGVIFALIATKREEKKLPMAFFITYLVVSVVVILITIGGVIMPSDTWFWAQQYVFMGGTILLWVMLFIDKKEVRENFGLNFKGHKVGMSFLMMFLFLVLYILRLVLGCVLEGEMGELKEIFTDVSTWSLMFVIIINFFLTFIIFFGEEYGWRYFLQPMLQKRFGLKLGVVLLGLIWGIWHLPLNVFYYSPETWVQSVFLQLITCIVFSIFFGYAYLKTGNMWVPIVIHFINNNMIVVITKSTELGNNVYSWKDVLSVLIMDAIVFLPFLFTKVYKKGYTTEV